MLPCWEFTSRGEFKFSDLLLSMGMGPDFWKKESSCTIMNFGDVLSCLRATPLGTVLLLLLENTAAIPGIQAKRRLWCFAPRYTVRDMTFP